MNHTAMQRAAAVVDGLQPFPTAEQTIAQLRTSQLQPIPPASFSLLDRSNAAQVDQAAAEASKAHQLAQGWDFTMEEADAFKQGYRCALAEVFGPPLVTDDELRQMAQHGLLRIREDCPAANEELKTDTD